MSEQPEQPPVVPEPSELETVARLAAEAATRARPDTGPRLANVEAQLAEILAALAAAAGPEGNAAKLNDRLTRVEQQVLSLRNAPNTPHPEQQKQLDDLRLKVATIERNTRNADS